MKLGKIKKGLAILMGIMAVCPMVYAQDTEIKEIASTITTEAEEAVEEEDELYPYFIGEEIIELIKKEGTAINQSQTHGNVKVTLHSIWADAHNYKLLLSAEHVDKTPFKESVNVQFEGRREVLSKEDYEKEQVLANIPEDATTEERLKIHATVDEWYKQFIKADGSVDMEAYIEKITEAVEAEHANIITGGTASGGFGESYTVPTNNYEKYFIMTGSNIMETLTDALVIELGTYKEVEWNRYVSPLDLVAYLEAHKKDILKTVPNTFSESEKSYLEKLKSIDPEAYEVEYKEVLARLEEEPKQFLQGNGLKLQVLEGVEDYYISDIGFIDGALHIKFINHGENIYSTRLSHAEEHVWSDYNRRYSEVDALGNEVEVNYEVYLLF